MKRKFEEVANTEVRSAEDREWRDERQKYDPLNIYAIFDRTAKKVVNIVSFANDDTCLLNVRRSMEQSGITSDDLSVFRLCVVDSFNPYDLEKDMEQLEL